MDKRFPNIFMSRPPRRARTMRTSRAKTVPPSHNMRQFASNCVKDLDHFQWSKEMVPGAAMGPRIVHAERKIELVVRIRVK